MNAGPLAGAGLGLGLLLVIVGLRPARPPLSRALARVDAAARFHLPAAAGDRGLAGRLAGLHRRVAAELAVALDRRGWLPATQAADLAVLGRDRGELFAAKLTGAAAGLVALPVLVGAAAVAGLPGPAAVALPGWLALSAGVVGFLLPDAALRRRAAGRRRDFRVAVGGYLDLVAMRMASGAGLAEALADAAGIGAGPAFALVDASGAQAEQSLRASAAALRDRERTTPARTDRLAAVFPEMPVVLALAAVLTDRLRLRLAGTDPERGETIQWVIITAVGAAMAIMVVMRVLLLPWTSVTSGLRVWAGTQVARILATAG